MAKREAFVSAKDVEQEIQKRTLEITSVNAVLTQEIEERKHAVEKLRQDTMRLNEIITAQSILASAEFDQNSFIKLVVQRIELLTPASGAVVEFVEGDEMVYRAGTGTAAAHMDLRFKMAGSLSGLCVQSRQVLRCDDTERDPRVNREACRKVGAASMVVAPLFYAGNAVGVLKIFAAKPYAFEERDVQTLQLMAGLIGSAIGHQTHFETIQKLLTERTQALAALEEEVIRRKHSEEVLKAKEKRIRLLIESSYDAFIATDMVGKITDWNEQAEVTFGWTKQEVIGLDLGNVLIPKQYLKSYREGLKNFLTTGEAPALNRRMQLQVLHRSGKEFPIELTMNAIKNGDDYEFCAFLHDITKRMEDQQRLTHLAHYDQLTDLPNRGLFNDRLTEAMLRSRRTKRLMALMYLDIDNFKEINDGKGHMTGDALLKSFAVRLKESLRASDTVARIGGDEFAVIVEELKEYNDIDFIAQKIIENIGRPFQCREHILSATTSIGIISFKGEEGIDNEKLLTLADRALYKAKEAGRNTYKIDKF